MDDEIRIGKEGNFDAENTIFVAVGRNVKESKSILLWAVQRFSGKKICLLHVHQPTHFLDDGMPSTGKLGQKAVKAFRELEQQRMQKGLNQHFIFLCHMGVHAGKVWIEMGNMDEGIVRIIAEHDIRWLVMGAAAEKHYSEKMSELKSRKAIFVCEKAPPSCNIWFTCKGCLIYTRSANVCSDVKSIVAMPSPTNTSKVTSSPAELSGDANTFRHLHHQCSLADKEVGTSRSNLNLTDAMSDISCLSSPNYSRYLQHDSLSGTFLAGKSEGKAIFGIHDKLEHAILDAENVKKKAFEESVRRWKAEEDALEAVQKAEALESLCLEEINHRKGMEETLAMQSQELENYKNLHDQFLKELQVVQDQRPGLERQIEVSHLVEKEIEEKILQAVKLLIMFKEQRDELKIEHEKAAKEINSLQKLVGADAVNLSRPQLFSFSFLEITDATQNFDPSWKIGDGRTGSIYKGFLRHVKVAIKMLPSRGSQSNLEFEHEVEVLSRVRHPNLVTLVGTCLESRSLIYEYLENGSLEDWLSSQAITPSLPWQTRINIAINICSTLIFLHSNNPSIIHGNLKLTKVLLDTNFVSKLSDSGIGHLVPRVTNPITPLHGETDSGVSACVDPEFTETGELTKESDVYSFGVVLLRLLTGKPVLGMVKYAKCALESGNLNTVLDSSAGNWPLKEAENLARLALMCCEDKRVDRPDLASDVWTWIEPMRDLCAATCLDSEGHRRAPSHFICPIFQEVMKDPYTAADGFTYEGDAIKGWLNGGHMTSPMTNLKLDNCDLLPNYALYNAIQEWQQQS